MGNLLCMFKPFFKKNGSLFNPGIVACAEKRPDVPDGTYILSLISHDYSFDQVIFI